MTTADVAIDAVPQDSSILPNPVADDTVPAPAMAPADEQDVPVSEVGPETQQATNSGEPPQIGDAWTDPSATGDDVSSDQASDTTSSTSSPADSATGDDVVTTGDDLPADAKTNADDIGGTSDPGTPQSDLIDEVNKTLREAEALDAASAPNDPLAAEPAQQAGPYRDSDELADAGHLGASTRQESDYKETDHTSAMPESTEPRDQDTSPEEPALVASGEVRKTVSEVVFIDTGVANYQVLVTDLIDGLNTGQDTTGLSTLLSAPQTYPDSGSDAVVSVPAETADRGDRIEIQSNVSPGQAADSRSPAPQSWLIGDVQVVLIDSEHDGIDRISEALDGIQGLASVHIVSHGARGSVKLGSTWLTSDELSANADTVAAWGKALAERGDLLFYGCDLATNAEGQALVDHLAALTGADVAASTDDTGHASLGGNWALEYRTGQIETDTAFSVTVQQNWSALLNTFTVTNTNDSGSGSLRQAIIDANTLSGADTIEFSITGGGPHVINLLSGLPDIAGTVLLDGWSEPDHIDNPVIRIDGTSAGGANGLRFSNNADNSTVRGLMITNFSGDGIRVDGDVDFITIAGNWIGTAGTGTTGVGNGDHGIDLRGANATIGGLGVNDGNVITNSGDEGLNIDGSGDTDHFVQGNIIGLDPDGASGSGNSDVGIAIISGNGNTIGGTSAEARNIISNNTEGIEINTDDNVVQGNYIGTDVSGLLDRGNRSDDGVEIQGFDNLIGGAEAGAGNVIAYNALDGVSIQSGDFNAVLGNQIHSNSGLGIDLGTSGVNGNDAGDGDGGANNLQNYPVLTSVGSDATGTNIVGSLNSNADTTYRIEFFTNRPTIADGSNGEGERYLGYTTVTTNGSGNASFNLSLTDVWVNTGDEVTATATVDIGGGDYGDTSEFAANRTASSPGIVVVDTTSDAAGGNVSSIANLGNSRGGDDRISLREAIEAANNTANAGGNPDRIVFSIPAIESGHYYYTDDGVSGQVTLGNRAVTNAASDTDLVNPDPDFAKSWWSIQVGAAGLPTISQALVIDGTTQAGFTSTPIIELDGTPATGSDGLFLDTGSDGSTIRGLVINGFGDAGIKLEDSDGHTIAGNYLGTDVSGTEDLGNATYGMEILNAAGNQVGGSTAADRNVIAGNDSEGITIWGSGSDSNTIQGNYIGVDATGDAALGNIGDGIVMGGGANNNTIGGDRASGEGNVISGNTGVNSDGIEIDNVGADNNKIYGNYIGTNFDGTSAIANARHGVVVYDGVQGTEIGGTGTGQGNIISGNAQNGIVIDGNGKVTTTANFIVGNYIGLDAFGLVAIANLGDGIRIFGSASGNTVGGNNAAARNIISGNSGYGVQLIIANGNTVRGNYIGTDAGGDTSLTNGNDAIYVNNSGATTIGGGSAGEGNVINAAFGQTGIDIFGTLSTSTVVQGNYIGSDKDGDTQLLGGSFGINVFDAANTIIGGSAPGEGNVILGYLVTGINVSGANSAGTWLAGNAIGTDASGTLDPTTGIYGVTTQNSATDVTIGGTAVGAGNTIAFNSGNGIRLFSSTTDDTSILGNAIYANGDIAVDLGGDGVSANDADDADTGPNDLINFPVLTNVVQNGTDLDIDFELDLPAGNYRIEFFDSAAGLDDSGFGEGETYLGYAHITTTGAAGYETFSTSLTGVTASDVLNITTNATEADGTFTTFGSTSEFGPQFLGSGVLEVTTTSDSADGDTSSIAALLGNRGSDGEISLREAIAAANNTANGVAPDEIRFNIATDDLGHYYYTDDGIAGQISLGNRAVTNAATDAALVNPDPDFARSWWSIQVGAGGLPDITEALVIDGATQTGFIDSPIIELDGSTAGAGVNGLTLTSGSSTIRGLVVNQFDLSGIAITGGTNTTIVGNYLGTDASGTRQAGVDVQDQGVYVTNSTGNIIGGAAAADANVISGNRLRGVLLDQLSASANQVLGNYIGTNFDGSAQLTNTGSGQQIGIYLWDSPNNVIGTAAAGNVLSGNTWYGIYGFGASGTGNVVQGNIIGMDATASFAIGNGDATRAGVELVGAGFTIGGAGVGEGNLIAGNPGNGISIVSSSSDNSILSNQIYNNGALGIDLAGGAEDGFGVTDNDPGDGDGGANRLQNYPVLTSAVTDGSTTITIDGSLDTDGLGQDYRIEFFASASADGSGHGEAERYIGFVTVTTDGTGNASFSTPLAATVAVNEHITATATVDQGGGNYGDTSEFSQNLLATDQPPLINDDMTSVAEDAINTTLVYDVDDANTGNDTDADGDAITYSITAGNTDGIFGINTSTGQITVVDNTNLDYETTQQYILTIQASDGTNIDSANITIDVTNVNDNAPLINDDAASVAEDAVNTTPVYNVDDANTGNDTDADGDTVTYSITGGNTDGIFGINAGTGQITVVDNTNLDYETTQQYVLSIQASDGTNFDSANITIDVTNVNDNAPLINDDTASVAEDAVNTTLVYDVDDANTGNDTDADGDTITYSIAGGNTDGIFGVNPSTGQITVVDNTNLDYETTQQYVLSIQASDGTNLDTANITVDVTNVNDNAPLINDDTASVAEDAINTTPVYNVDDTNTGNDTDADGDAITYSITAGNTDGIFGMNASTGQITVIDNTNLDYETTQQYVLTIQASDGTNVDTANITIDVTNVNDNAPLINDDTTSVAEDAVNTTPVYNVDDANTGNDTDADGDAITYSITGGNTDGIFGINASTGQITVADNTNLDYETTQQYVLTIQASDGTNLDSTNITINVTNVNDNAPLINDDTTSVAEDAVNTTQVYNVDDANTGNDTDADGDAITYSITGGNTDGIFGINASTGQITVADNTNLDYETTQQYVLTIQASDGTNLDSANITINVTNVNDNAPLINDDTASVAEDAVNTTPVYNVDDANTGNDTDADGDTITYSITGGNTDGIFGINTSTGQVTVVDNTNLDYETTQQYILTIQASDGTNLDTANITIDVTNVNDNAPLISDDTASVAEDAINTTPVYNIDDNNTGNDTDADGDAITYSITGGNTDGIFGINASTGQITVADNTNLDYETTQQYVLTIQASDGTNLDTANITVDVTNVNDNAPLISDDTASVAEDAINTTPVYNIDDNNTGNDTDADGDAITYSITGGNTDGIFGINASTGQITVTDNTNLDYETTQQYVLTIQASDGTNIDSANITIDVTNVNDNAPLISDDTASVAEDAINATPVYNVDDANTATDSDADGDAITYSITGGNTDNIFGINASTGQITVADNTNLDYETTQQYVLTIQASDGTNVDNANITVDVTNVNDNAPLINDDTASVAEDAVNTTPVYNVDDANTGNDTDLDSDAITYSITGGNTDGIFGVNASTGQITIVDNTNLDYETTQQYVLTIQASDGTNVDSANITIDVINVNDNAPLINDDTTSVAEDAVNTTPVYNVDDTNTGNDTDADGDAITYSITGGNTDGIFGINASTGQITVIDNTNLDYETTQQYVLSIQASDGTNVDSANITIDVTNVNDNAPLINDDTASVAEDAVNTTLVYDVDDANTGNDTDADGDAITYSITGGNTDGIFGVNPSTGQITVVDNTNLDHETTQQYVLTIQASDGTNLDTANITVDVTNVNDNAPLINDDTASVAEDAINTTPVYNVDDTNTGNDTDADGDAITYSITGGNTDGIFGINASTGQITVVDNTNLDYETTQQYILTIQASDGTNVDNANITVDVTNVNDNAPLINDDTASVAEDAVNTTPVYDVDDANTGNDTDADGDTITYSITGGNTDGIFGINTSTGQITVVDNTNLDYETTQQYVLTVQASDGTNVDTANITVDVTNVNDNAPLISDDTASVAEDAINTTPVYNIDDTNTGNDTDADGDTITYSITGGNTDGIFGINASTGQITIVDNTNLDYETTQQYVLTIQASDGTSIDSANITIDVTNVNDNAPLINDDTASVAEDAVNTTPVYNVDDTNTGNDTDADGDAITYLITGGNTDGIFGVNASTGQITVVDNTNLDYETTQQYVLTIQASDGTNVDTANITIDITNVNDNAPLISDDAASVAEDAVNTTPVYNVDDANTGNDSDADGDAITYSITGGNTDGIFSINATTGQITVTDNTNLDYETTQQYVLTVQASDGTNIDSANITIDITNVNDNAPLISDDTASVAEDAINTTPVYNIDDTNTANDTDADGDAITYSITGGNTDGIFGINATTGQITVVDNTNLDYETTQQYVLTIQASDGTNIDSANITIDITNVNDNAPLISDDTASVAEDAINTTPVYNIDDTNTGNDTDADGDTITYSITAGNTDGIFGINASTGQITVVDNTNLDYETTQQYVLTIQASDGTNVDSANVTIDVTDINEAPTVSLANTITTLPESTDTTSSIKVADIVVTDDALGTNTLSVTGADAALFEIVSSELYIRSGAILDFETNPSLDVTVLVNDVSVGDTPDDAAALAIAVTDSKETSATDPDPDDDGGDDGGAPDPDPTTDPPVSDPPVGSGPGPTDDDRTDPPAIDPTDDPLSIDTESAIDDEPPAPNRHSDFYSYTEPDDIESGRIEVRGFDDRAHFKPYIVKPALPSTGIAGLPILSLSNPVMPPISTLQIPIALYEMIDRMKQEMAESGPHSEESYETLTIAIGSTLALSAGYVAWLLRFGALAAAVASLTPLWREFDPLPVLNKRQPKDRNKHGAEDYEDTRIDRLFEGAGNPHQSNDIGSHETR